MRAACWKPFACSSYQLDVPLAASLGEAGTQMTVTLAGRIELNMTSTNVAQALAAMRGFPAEEARSPQAVADGLLEYISALSQVKTAASAPSCAQEACAQLQSHLLGIRKSPRELRLHEVSLLTIWPDIVEQCIQAPDIDHGLRLNQILQDSGVTSELEIEPVCALASDEGSALVDGDLSLLHMESLASGAPPSILGEALQEIADLTMEMGHGASRGLSQDGIMRYAMAVMQIREEAQAAGLSKLEHACDDISIALAELMDSPDGDNQTALDSMAAFADAAPSMCTADEPASAVMDNSSVEVEVTATEPLATELDIESLSEMAELWSEPQERPLPDLSLETSGSTSREATPVTDLQPVSTEMLGLLQAELDGVGQAFQELLDELASDADFGELGQAGEACADIVERLGMAAEAVGLLALHGMLAQLSQRLRTDGAGQRLSTHMLRELIPDFLGRLGSYIATPNDASACAGLVDVLRHQGWSEPLPTGAALTMIESLADVVLTDEPAQQEDRAQSASDDDVSLTLPDDLDGMVLENLLQELPHQTRAFTEAIGRIASGNGGPSDVDTAKRAAHTLKGAANTVGARGIANLTHHLEDILMAYSAGNTLPGRTTASLLVRAGDCLEAMNETLQGTGPVPDDAREVLQEVLDRANSLDRDGLTEEDPVEVASVAMRGTEAQKPQTSESAVSMLRIPTQLVDELLRLVGESITTNAQTQERLRMSLRQAQAVRAQNRLLRQLVGELDALVDIRGIAATTQKIAHDGSFDALEMQQYGELHTVTNRLMEAVTDANEMASHGEDGLVALGEVLEVQSRLQLESQGAVLRTRMVRVETVVPRLQRGVRQAARLLDKSVKLNVLGGETLVDGNVLAELVDPLMHVLRNSVDHGIEAPADRRARGKNATGHIELTFSREGNNVLVRCRDDGHGLDVGAIKMQATRLGLLAATTLVSDAEAAQLILVSGFSTRNETTQMSGRGIGMDIVNKRVLDLKGSLELHSSPGQGLTVEIRIPLSMLSTHSLLVQVGKHTVAVSTRNIEDIHFVLRDQIRNMGNRRHYTANQVVHDLVALNDLLNLPIERHAEERAGFPVLLVRQSQGVVRAIQVQEILDTSNLVLKTLGDYVPSIQGVAGAAILGNGSVVPVIDLPDLLRAGVPVRGIAGGSGSLVRSEPVGTEEPGQRRVLVVDDSLSARRGTAQVMKDAGYEVRTAIDGLDALAVLEKFIPDLILADMEMPRMNGLELTFHVRGQPKTRQIPVVMITSRSTEKHRKQASEAGVNVYLTKPFNDDVLLSHMEALLGAVVE